MFKELFVIYESLNKGETQKLPEPKQYRHYIEWLERQDWSKAEAFWRKQLEGLRTFSRPFGTETESSFHTKPNAEALGYFRDVPSGQGAGEKAIEISEVLTSQLRSLAKKNDITLNTFIQGAWALLLSRYSNRDSTGHDGAFMAQGDPTAMDGVARL